MRDLRTSRTPSAAFHHDDIAPQQRGAGQIAIEDRRRDRASTAERRLVLIVDYAGDADGCYAAIGELLNEYERYLGEQHRSCPGNCPVERSGAFIVSTMLEWKAIYGDGRLAHWTCSDVAEYLLGHFPRKISVERRVLGDVPSCVRDLMYFLSDLGILRGDALDDVAAAGEQLYEQFVAAALDRRNRGLAKSFLTGSPGGLVDPVVVEQSIRDVSPPVAVTGAGGRGPRAPAAKRAKRKAARGARKRNRT